MAYRIYACESCPNRIAVDAKMKQRPLACPKCRGMLIMDALQEDFQGTKVDCPDCENSFLSSAAPFKCAFCDHTFSKSYRYF